MSTIESQGRTTMSTSNDTRAPYSPITPADSEAQALFPTRHIGPRVADVDAMLSAVGASDMDTFIGEVVPADIRLDRLLDLPTARTEYKLWHDLRQIAENNKLFRSCIGMGYVGTITPPVILRNVLENPQWYTQYTPYQPETAQGRLEALLNFQTMISDLTGLPLASSSLLDEGTAAAVLLRQSKNFVPTNVCRFRFTGTVKATLLKCFEN